MPDASPQSDSPQQHLSGCLTRLCWMILGNAALLAGAIAVAKSKRPAFAAADAAFWLIAAAILFVRYADIRWFAGQTADGHAPATMRHWRRYAIIFTVVALGIWIMVRIWAHYHAGTP